MSDDEARKSLGQVFGSSLEIAPLPDGWSPIEGVFLVKCLDAEGAPTWAIRETDGINAEEVIGVLTVQLDIMREQVVDAFRSEDGTV